MFGKNSFPSLRLRHFLAPLILLTGLSTYAAPPAWWSQVGSDGLTVINSAVTNADPKAVANIGQAKFMAKRALELLRPIIPLAAAQIEADLVGPGKIIPTWDAPVAGTALAEAQFAPLRIGQLKAIADPFYTALSAADSEWVLAQLAANGTIDNTDSDNFFPWTSNPADNADKAVATIGQLKAVFALNFETLTQFPHDEDSGLADEYVAVYPTDEVHLLPLLTSESENEPEAAASIVIDDTALAIKTGDYRIECKKGLLSLKKFGYSPFVSNQATSKYNRYLKKQRYTAVSDESNKRVTVKGWQAGLNPYGKSAGSVSKKVLYSALNSRVDTINPLNGKEKSTGGALDNALVAQPGWDWRTATRQGKFKSNNHIEAYRGYLDFWRYGYEYPNLNQYYRYSRPTDVYYDEWLSAENTIENVKQLALDNKPVYPASWTAGVASATWDVWSHDMGVTYSRLQFRLVKNSGATNARPVKAYVFFDPKGSGSRQEVASYSWDGQGQDMGMSVDPAALRFKIEGTFHLGVAAAYLELDEAQASMRASGKTVIIPAGFDESGSANPPDTHVPGVKFPGMNDYWYDGSTITLTRKSGTGSVRFKVVDPISGNPVEVQLGSNLATDFFLSNGRYSGCDWQIEGVDPGPVTMELTYSRGSTTVSATCSAAVVRADFQVDADNSGTIDDIDRGNATAERPFDIWPNDDDDVSPGESQRPDYTTPSVDGVKDLGDFFPVFLDIQQLVKALPPSTTLKYKLKQADGAVNFAATNLTREAAFTYRDGTLHTGFGASLSDPAAYAATMQITGSGVELSTEFLNNIKDYNKGVISFASA